MGYNVGDWVVCTEVTQENYEGLELSKAYEVVGATLLDSNLVYTLRDADNKLHYSIDRFKTMREYLQKDKVEFDDFWNDFNETVEENEEPKKLEEVRMPKYNVGDLVRVREDLVRGKDYAMEDGRTASVVDDMIDLAGQIVTITDNSNEYSIAESIWSFTDDMFDGFVGRDDDDEDDYDYWFELADEDDEEYEDYATDGEISEEEMAEFIPYMQRPDDVSFELAEEALEALRKGRLTISKEGVSVGSIDMVNHPPHYKHGDIETLEVIRMSLTKKEFIGYLKGNVLKYRERAPFKGNQEQDYAKAKFYYDRYVEAKSKKEG